MSTKVILIRHGTSHHMEDEVVGGRNGCRGLTDIGRIQVERLADRLKRELADRPTAVYSSVLRRAVETGEILAAALEVGEVSQDCGLCTWHSPSYADGMKKREFQRVHGQSGGGTFRPFENGNESWSELVARVGRSLEEIASRHTNQTVVVATHAEAINSSMIVFGQIPLMIGLDTVIEPASITEWTTTGDPASWPRPRWTLMRLNDSAHLG